MRYAFELLVPVPVPAVQNRLLFLIDTIEVLIDGGPTGTRSDRAAEEIAVRLAEHFALVAEIGSFERDERGVPSIVVASSLLYLFSLLTGRQR